MASISKRTDGKWRARYRDDGGREHAKHFTRKVDAQRWLDEVTASVITGQYVDPAAGRVTLADFYAAWATRQVWESTTVKAMDLAVRSTTFIDVPLSRLRRSHLEAWIKSMDGAGLAPGTIKTRLVNVRPVLRAAVRDRIIPSDPSDGLSGPRGRRPQARMSMPSPEQVASLMDVIDARYSALVALAAFAGLRLGEVAGLQIGDIDFLRRQLRVERQVQRVVGGNVEVRGPKYGSDRTVYLPDDMVALLSRHVATHRPEAGSTAWLFEASSGQPPHQNTIGHAWRSACRRAGITGVTLHDLRHFYASGLIAAGCDVVTVQRALGHAKATTTLNTYAHLWPTAEDRTRAAASGLMTTAAADFLRTREQM